MGTPSAWDRFNKASEPSSTRHSGFGFRGYGFRSIEVLGKDPNKQGALLKIWSAVRKPESKLNPKLE